MCSNSRVCFCCSCVKNEAIHLLFLVFTVKLFSRSLSNPGNSADLSLKSGRYCKKDLVTYRPKVTAPDGGRNKVEVGNLEYFYNRSPYELCLGSKSVKDGKWKPMENDEVSAEEKVCKVNNSCKLDYGKILFVNSNE